jgi:hypothetical protein
MLVLLLGAVLAVSTVRGEEGDCPEFECPAKVIYNKFELIIQYVIVRANVIRVFRFQILSSLQSIVTFLKFSVYAPPPSFKNHSFLLLSFNHLLIIFFSLSYIIWLLVLPLPPLPSATCLSFSVFLCVAGRADLRERGWVGGGRRAKSYDREKDWPSVNHSILFPARFISSFCLSIRGSERDVIYLS